MIAAFEHPITILFAIVLFAIAAGLNLLAEKITQ